MWFLNDYIYHHFLIMIMNTSKIRSLKLLVYLLLLIHPISCKKDSQSKTSFVLKNNMPTLNLDEANRLASLPFGCLQIQYPNKLGQTLNDSTHIQSPKALHPAFYGCFDWHSAVHGHWSLISLLKRFPNLDQESAIRQKLKENISEENIKAEVAYFRMLGNKTYERTYGWAWILKLAEALYSWDDSLAKELIANLQPLVDLIVDGYLDFLPKLNYPIRVGEHGNTAFGLSFAWDYANMVGNTLLKKEIEKSIDRFYINDVACPITWEPSGFDFLSPCLEEANLVRKILTPESFKTWFNAFLPQMASPSFNLEPGKVSDRTDGNLVHIDGLNFSRAWCLYGIVETIPEYGYLKQIADDHINYSLSSITDGGYEGTHWLGTFALLAISETE